MAGDVAELRPFDALFASTVAGWVRAAEDLFALAPGTLPPLTAAKVAGWTRERGRAYLLSPAGATVPCGYGEINPMPRSPADCWLGHLVVDPEQRGRGWGRRLTELLIHEAFNVHSTERLILVVFPDNTSAVNCYLNCGFVCSGEEQHGFGDRPGRFRMLRMELRRAEWPGSA